MASILNVDQIKNAAGTSAITIDSSGDLTFNGSNTASVSDSGWILSLIHI